jgi:serpin B
VLLPKEGQDAAQLAASLDAKGWQALMEGFSQQEGTLFLPRFELEFESLLNDSLQALGMGVAFDPAAADFTRINPAGDLFISFVLHKTYVKVNEEGTEAAAVTVVGVGTTSVPSTFTMRVDRPFVFIIHDRESKALLFMGLILDPPSA